MAKEAPPYGARNPEARQLPHVLRNQPALMAKGWLAEGVFPELDELREEHHALLDEVSEKVSACVAQDEAYEAEDANRAAALAEGEAPAPVTGSAERQDALGTLNAERVAALGRLAAFVERAKEIIRDQAGERPTFPDNPGAHLRPWRQQLAATKAEAADEVEQAKEALRKAERMEADAVQIERYLDRLVRPKGGRFDSAPELGRFPTRAQHAATEAPPAMSGAGMVS